MKKIKRKDGTVSKRGLWDNVRAKRKRGEAPATPGSDDYPEKKAFTKASGRFKKILKTK